MAEAQAPVRERRKNAHNFPPVETRQATKTSIVNLAPLVFHQTSDNNPEAVITVLRAACQYAGGIDRVARDLGLRDEKEHPLKVHPYELSFYGMPIVLPVAVIDYPWRGGQVMSSVGTIPLEPISRDGWTFGFEQKWVDDGGGAKARNFQNFMERRDGERSATYMRIGMIPFVREGIEFKPESWSGFFEYCAAKTKDGEHSVEFYDHARIHAEFTHGEKGLSFHGDFRATLEREVLFDKRVKFKLGGPSYPDRSPTNWPRLVSGGEWLDYSPDALARMAKPSAWKKDGKTTHNDMVSATIFPNATGENRAVDYAESLHCLLEKFRDGDPDKLAGFDWLKFS